MKPTLLLQRQPANLLAADTTTLAATMAMHTHLAIAPFTPGLNLALGDLTPATFTGSTPANAGTGTQPTYLDAATGLWTIRIKEPAGGWSWVCTADPVAPQTVYGYYVTDNADAVLLGADLLAQSVTIQAAGDGLTIGEILLAFDPTSPH